jgi:hypothetical protein
LVISGTSFCFIEENLPEEKFKITKRKRKNEVILEVFNLYK